MGSYNLFAYCSNNPVKYVDSFGEFAITAVTIFIGAGAIVGGIMGAVTALNTGGNVIEGTLQGVATGALTSSLAFTTAHLPFARAFMISIIGGAVGGGTIDIITQALSHYVENNTMDDFSLDPVRVFEAAGASALSALAPTVSSIKTDPLIAFGFSAVSADVSALISVGQIIAHGTMGDDTWYWNHPQTLEDHLTNWMDNYTKGGVRYVP